MGLLTSFGCSFLPFLHRLLPKHFWPLLIICLLQARQVLTVSPREALGKEIHDYTYQNFFCQCASATTLVITTAALVLLKFLYCLELFDRMHPSGFLASDLLDPLGPMGVHLFLASQGINTSVFSRIMYLKMC